ncbi:transmembrane channel-like protein 5 isoform X1 [Homarus americanus]|uniref:transmembrane channel-like protein 5 isoform X1 n=1 Tax=Homarus americanus TaxID=6706 RepID=UPI001C45A9E1|nr:transmembrane channel-like protein 5 isoform X1 [Homarus americanus]XP_042203711.1 transmembrane channel-like protein 5 isoform X1 [Homarus americanus]
MASHVYAVEVEDIPLNEVNYEQTSSSDEDYSHVHLRRARTDVHLSQRRSQDSIRYHSYNGREHHLQHTLPSRHEGELLSTHTLHYGSEHRPSAWFNTMIARRRRGVSPNTEEEAVDEIAEAMVGDEKLMSDDVDGELKMRETLRELTKPLRVKKELRRKLTARRSSHRSAAQTISRIKYLKYSISMWWYKLRQSVRDTVHDYSLWHKELKEIEGTFGTGVGSYFRFLRYLFLLNLGISFLVCGFLLTPQLLAHARVNDPPSANNTAALVFLVNDGSEMIASAMRVSDSLPNTNIADPSLTSQKSDADDADSSTSYTDNGQFGALDWLTGAGWFNNTELYYGTYLNRSFYLVTNLWYNIPEAYFFVILLAYIIYFIAIRHRVNALYKNNYIDIEHDVSATFVRKVFSSWDFSITERKAAKLKHRSIYNELKELLQEFLNEELEEDFWSKVIGWSVKFVFWVIILTLLGLLGWATYLMLDSDINKDIGNGFNLLVYPLIVTCIIMFVPSVFGLIVKFEGYKIQRHRIYVTLMRTILLELTVLGVLVGFWFMQATDPVPSTTETPVTTDDDQYDDDDDDDDDSGEFISEKLRRAAGPEKNDDCWETSLGQEFYRLLIIDFLIALVMHLFTLMFFVATCKNTTKGKVHQFLLEFDISRNTLHLIYNQTLLWAGLFFCPLSPLIVLLKITIMFYIQKFSVLKVLRPDERPWRAAQTETVFFALTLVSLVLAVMGYGFILFRGNTSSCGPFQNHEPHYIDFLWDITQSNEQIILVIISWILKPGVVAGILGILLILVYCAKSMAEGRAEMIKVLRRQLELEVRDRAFLLQLTEKYKRGEHKVASPAQVRAASPPPSTSVGPHELTQRASFVFSDNKVHPADSAPRPRHFSDYSDSHSLDRYSS